jgi:hypothetical protein
MIAGIGYCEDMAFVHGHRELELLQGSSDRTRLMWHEKVFVDDSEELRSPEGTPARNENISN